MGIQHTSTKHASHHVQCRFASIDRVTSPGKFLNMLDMELSYFLRARSQVVPKSASHLNGLVIKIVPGVSDTGPSGSHDL
jgi:hypothetical protein